MADESSLEGTSSKQVNSDSSGSAIRINIKTLDSQIYSFNVKKNISVPALKEDIVRTIGVPLEQQRLIYRGKVLKDDQLLSHHSVEDGDTLHLVVRPQAQDQTTPSIVNPDTSRTSSQANDSSSSSQQQPRVGQVAHSVFLGSVNIGDRHGEAMPFDLSQIVPAVLNLLGAPNFGAAGGPNLVPVVSAASSGTGTQTSQSTSQTQSGNPANGGIIFPNQQFSQMPSMRNVISDALTTLLEFIDRMQGVLQSSDNSLNNEQNQPHSANSSLDARGLPTPETLRSVLERTQVLLRDNAVAALSHLSTRLQREEGSSDPLLRAQIQTEAMQLGAAMQHLGAMLLELGRVTMTLRMGQTQAESSVFAGPAVYISPAGPNPIMVQPFPFQSSSLFGSSPPLFSEMLGRGASGDSSSNMNIHLHAGPAEAIHGEHVNAEQTTPNRTGSSDSISTSGLPSREVASALQARVVPQSGGQVLSVAYPVHVRVQQPVIIRSGNQVLSTIISRDVQLHEPTSVPLPSLESDSIPVIVAEVTARSPTGFNGIARVQSSSMQSSATNGSQGSDNSGRQSDMSNSTLLPPEVYGGITHTTELNVERSCALSGDPQPQNVLSMPENSVGSSSIKGIVLSSPEDLLSGNNVYDGSKKVLDAESSKQNGFGEDHVSDFTVSRKVEQHIQLNDDQSSSMDATNSTGSPANFQPGLSDVKYFKRETNSLELGQSPPSNRTVECKMPTPLGLGVGGLQSKKRNKPVKSKGSSDAQAKASSSDHSQQSQTSHVDGENANESSNQFPSLISQFMDSMPLGGQAPSGHMDFAGMMTNAMQSSGLNNLLSGVASHSRVPTGDLRSMLEQCVQNPAVQNTFSQLVQQVGQSGDQMSNTGQGRFDFKGMIQQMLPAVSQALGSSSASSAAAMDIQSEPDSNDVLTCADESLNDSDYQVDLGQALERIEQNDDPKGIFGALLKISGGLCGEQTVYQDIVELGDDEELANEFTEILRQDIRRRLAKESKSDDKS